MLSIPPDQSIRMTKLVSGRILRLWAYTVSHSSLLLLSSRVEGTLSRLLLVFKQVEFLSIEKSFTCLNASVRELGEERISFRFEANPRAFEVVASTCLVSVDAEEDGAPSELKWIF